MTQGDKNGDNLVANAGFQMSYCCMLEYPNTRVHTCQREATLLPQWHQRKFSENRFSKIATILTPLTEKKIDSASYTPIPVIMYYSRRLMPCDQTIGIDLPVTRSIYFVNSVDARPGHKKEENALKLHIIKSSKTVNGKHCALMQSNNKMTPQPMT